MPKTEADILASFQAAGGQPDVPEEIIQASAENPGAPVAVPEVLEEGSEPEALAPQEAETEGEGVDPDLLALQPNAADHPEIAAEKKKALAAYNRLQNKLNNAKPKQQSPDEIHAAAFRQLLSAPNGPQLLEQMQRASGVQAQGGGNGQQQGSKQISPDRAARDQMIQKNIDPNDAAALPTFNAIIDNRIEDVLIPHLQHAMARLDEVYSGVKEQRWKAETDGLPTADTYRQKAQELMQAMEAIGRPMSARQALITVSEGKVLTDQRVAEKKGKAAQGELGRPESPNGMPAQPPKTGPKSEKDIMASYQRRVGLNSIRAPRF